VRFGSTLLTVTAALALTGSSTGIAAASSLAPPSLYWLSGTSESSVVVGDVDGDGRPDVVTGTRDGHEVVVQSVDARTQVLRPGQRVDVGTAIDSLAGGDLDEDGRLDVLVGTDDGILILRGTASGLAERQTFEDTGDAVGRLFVAGPPGDRAVFYPLATGVYRAPAAGGAPAAVPVPRGAWPLAVADLTGDGAPDVAFLQDGAVSVLDATPSGWKSESPTPLPPEFRGDGVVADADADGDADLLLSGGMPDERGAWTDRLLTLRREDAAWAGQDLVDAPGGQAVVGDVDADGTPDLVLTGGTGGPDGEIYRLGAGGPTPSGPLRGWGPLTRGEAVLADVSGDGRDDLVMSSGEELGVSLQEDGGPRPIAIRSDVTDPGLVAQRLPLPFDPYTWASGDVTDDGRADLVIAGSEGLRILAGRPGGSFSPDPLELPAPHDARRAAAVADLDADGDQDVVAASVHGLVVFRNDGHRLAPGELVPGTPVNGDELHAVDLFGDARPELAFRFASSQPGSGILPGGLAGPPIASRPPWFFTPGDVAGDIDDDGIVDPLDHGIWLRQIAPGSFEPIQMSSLDDRELSGSADLTGDGRPDFAGSRTDEHGDRWIDVYPSRPDGPPSPWPLAMPVAFKADWVGGGDLDGDGHGDLLVRRAPSGAGSLGVSFGGADGSQGAFRDLPMGTYDEPRQPRLSDLDGDGRADLSYVTGDPAVLVIIRVPAPAATVTARPAPAAVPPQASTAPPATRTTTTTRPTRVVVPSPQSLRTVLRHGVRLRCAGPRRCAAEVRARGTHWHHFAAPGTRLRLSHAQRRSARRCHAIPLRVRAGDAGAVRRTVHLRRP
jgi:hypothetical protein